MVNARRTAWICTFAIMVGGCATAHVKVAQEGPQTPQRFSLVAVPAFANDAGSDLPATAPENVAGALIATLQKDHPGAFREVTAVPSNVPGELLVRGTIKEYDPGSKAARFILIGLGGGGLQLEVLLVDGATGQTVEQFSTSGSIVAGGVIGASMGIDDMIKSATKEAANRIARYGAPGSS